MAETINVATSAPAAAPGTAGLNSQVNGTGTTVSGAAGASGGLGGGQFIEDDIDEELFRFQSDDTPLMQLMLKAKKVQSASPVMEHYMIDEKRCNLSTNAALTVSSGQTAILPLPSEDQSIPQAYQTIMVQGVRGYDLEGAEQTNENLLLYVVGTDDATGNPIVRAVNGPKTNKTDQVCKVPAIPANSKLVVMANAMYETQKEVAPTLIIPQPTKIPLQKRGMNQVVSDYFDAQKKRIPFTQAIIAEQAIAEFKREGNRTLWFGSGGKLPINTGKMGYQDVYFTKGVRWQIKKELQHTGKWTVEELIALAKMFFTGEDVPKTGIALCGKNFLENIQCIDYSKHPEIQISSKTNPVGWTVTNIHTVFGDLELKREPTLDRMGYSNSAAILGENRLVHYVYKNESSFEDRIEGEEAKRSGILVWDALALKGSCHIWIDGEGESAADGSTTFVMWDKTTAPTTPTNGNSPVYYLMQDCTAIAAGATKGEMWYYDGTAKAWKEYTGAIMAN